MGATLEETLYLQRISRYWGWNASRSREHHTTASCCRGWK